MSHFVPILSQNLSRNCPKKRYLCTSRSSPKPKLWLKSKSFFSKLEGGELAISRLELLTEEVRDPDTTSLCWLGLLKLGLLKLGLFLMGNNFPPSMASSIPSLWNVTQRGISTFLAIFTNWRSLKGEKIFTYGCWEGRNDLFQYPNVQRVWNLALKNEKNFRNWRQKLHKSNENLAIGLDWNSCPHVYRAGEKILPSFHVPCNMMVGILIKPFAQILIWFCAIFGAKFQTLWTFCKNLCKKIQLTL